jgi:hypothetical protein
LRDLARKDFSAEFILSEVEGLEMISTNQRWII